MLMMVPDRKDVEAAAGCSSMKARDRYREIATTAESGWDFSSRWGPHTTHVIPTDLNAFLLMMERNMQRFAQARALHSFGCKSQEITGPFTERGLPYCVLIRVFKYSVCAAY